MLERVLEAQFSGVFVWVALTVSIAVLVESRLLLEALRLVPSDASPHARGYVWGNRVAAISRVSIVAIFGVLLCSGSGWAGYVLAVFLVGFSIAPAHQYSLGFAHGYEESSGYPPQPAVVALMAAIYGLVTRGITAALCVAAA